MGGTDTYPGQNIRFRGILVDLDNTLYDFVAAKEEACRRVVDEVGVGDTAGLLQAFLFSPYGVESPLALITWLKEKMISDETVINRVVSLYSATKISAVKPYPGVYETLLRIRRAGIKIGAVTNASKDHATERLLHIQVSTFMDCLVTPDTTGLKKPNPGMFLHAAALLDIQPHQICVVGDNLVNDIRPAQQAGMVTVHAEYGNRLSPEYSKGIIPDFSITSFGDILPILGQ